MTANFSDSIRQLLTSGNDLTLFEALAQIKGIKNAIQEVNSVNHELASLAAKAFLQERYPDISWVAVNVLERDVNAPGPDLLIRRDGVQIVGEVKTTEPVLSTDFGAQQKRNLIADLNKLSSQEYSGFDRYLFVSDSRAFQILSTSMGRAIRQYKLCSLRQQPSHRSWLTSASSRRNRFRISLSLSD